MIPVWSAAAVFDAAASYRKRNVECSGETMCFARDHAQDRNRVRSYALRKTETGDPGMPIHWQNVGRGIRRQVFVGVPKRTIIGWIHRQRAVVAPAISERIQTGVCFNSQSGEEHGFALS